MPAPGQRLYTPAFWIAFVGHFFIALPALSIPVLGNYLKSVHSSSASEIGFIFSVGFLAGILLRPVFGWTNDRIGRRPTMLFSGGLFAAGFILYTQTPTLGPQFYMVRILHGIGGGALFGTLFTYALDLAPEGRRTETVAVFGLAGLVATAAGPPLGEWLAEFHGFDAYFYVMGIMVAVGTLLFIFVPDRRSKSEPVSFLKGIRYALGYQLVPIWIACFGFGIALGTVFTFVGLVVDERGISTMKWFFIPYGLTAILPRTIGRRLPDQIGPDRFLGPSILTYIIGLVVFAHARTGPVMIPAGILCGLGHGYIFPILNSMAGERSDPKYRGSVVAFFTMMLDLGGVLGTPVLGKLGETSYRVAFMFCAFLFGLCFIFKGFAEPKLVKVWKPSKRPAP